MTDSCTTKTNLCIGLPDTPRRLYEEIGEMLLDVLEDSCFTAALVKDGDTSALDADALLIIGDCQAFQQYANLLAKHTGKRPITILWMLDTLPPVSFTPQAARIGSRLSIYNDSLLFLRSHMKPVINSIPISVRRRLGLAACSALLSGLDEELQRTSQEELQGLDVNSRYEVIGRYEWMKSNYSAGWLDHIAANTPSKTAFLKKMQIPTHFAPFGYHPNTGEDMHLDRDIDVLFLGELDYGRRRPIVENVRDRLSEQGIELTIKSGNCYGRERNELLSRTKISLNVPRFNWDIPTIRLFMSMGCGSVVVSEDAGDTTPFVSGNHFIQAKADELAEVITYYVKHDKEREQMAENAKTLITTEYTLKNAVLRVLGVLTPPKPTPQSPEDSESPPPSQL